MITEDKPEALSFVLGANEAYFPGLLATICSTLIFLETKRPVEIFIFDGGVEAESKQLLEKRSVSLNPEVDIHWLEADLSPFQSLLPLNGNFMAYVRLLIPDLIDRSRVIWIDSDLLVLRDIAPLGDLSLEGLFAGACLESSIVTLENDISNLDELGISGDAPYFNSGVLIMNLDALRDFDFTRKTLQYLYDNHGQYCWHDQSAINVILYQNILKLPSCWNTLSTSLASDPDSVANDSSIVYHFLQRPKPWQRYEGDYFAKLLYQLFNSLECHLPEMSTLHNRTQALKWRFPRMAAFYFRMRVLLSYNDKQREMNLDFLKTWKRNVRQVDFVKSHRASYLSQVERFKNALRELT